MEYIYQYHTTNFTDYVVAYRITVTHEIHEQTPIKYSSKTKNV